MVFGGFNPEQYAQHYIYQNGEEKERYEIECGKMLWQEIAETFGKDAVVTRIFDTSIIVRISSIPSKMRTWVMEHVNECEVIGPKRFRDQIQNIVMDAYKKYWKNA